MSSGKLKSPASVSVLELRLIALLGRAGPESVILRRLVASPLRLCTFRLLEKALCRLGISGTGCEGDSSSLDAP